MAVVAAVLQETPQTNPGVMGLVGLLLFGNFHKKDINMGLEQMFTELPKVGSGGSSGANNGASGGTTSFGASSLQATGGGGGFGPPIAVPFTEPRHLITFYQDRGRTSNGSGGLIIVWGFS
jgi:hypothetical protein